MKVSSVTSRYSVVQPSMIHAAANIVVAQVIANQSHSTGSSPPPSQAIQYLPPSTRKKRIIETHPPQIPHNLIQAGRKATIHIAKHTLSYSRRSSPSSSSFPIQPQHSSQISHHGLELLPTTDLADALSQHGRGANSFESDCDFERSRCRGGG